MRVLIADDEPVSRRVLERSLKSWGYEVLVANDGLEALRLLDRPDAPKLLVLDWLMPGMDGLEVCRALRARDDERYRYIILVTSQDGQKEVIEGLESGADDYLTKPFDAQELRMRLRTGKRILHLMDELVTAREALRELAMQDALTGLNSRGAILESLRGEMQRATREGDSLGVVMVDIDHFKSINDNYGHPVGDIVLREVGRTLRKVIRAYDLAGRYGGEEFLIVLPGCDERTAVSHAERMRQAIEELEILTPSRGIRISASFGVTLAVPEAHCDLDTLIRAADDALYEAKRSGRNRVHLAELSLV